VSSSKSQDLLREATNLGELLVRLMLVDRDQVAHAAGEAKRRGVRLGEMLVELDLVTPAQLQEALELQAKVRQGGTAGIEAFAGLLEQQRAQVAASTAAIEARLRPFSGNDADTDPVFTVPSAPR
jgi:hypothetical protein